MKKTNIKGYTAFALLADLDDDLIVAATLPEAPAAVSAAAPATEAGRPASTFSRFMRTAWAAVIPTVAVSLAIIVALVTVGQKTGFAPPASEGGPGLPSGTMGALDHSPSDNNGLSTGKTPEWAEPAESDEIADEQSPGFIPGEPGQTPGESPEQEAGPVAVLSDGFTVYPKGYCVWMSGQQKNDDGELAGFEADGFGAANQLGAIKDELPYMSTSGNSFSLSLSDGMTLQDIRVFEIVEIQSDTYEELALGTEGADFSHDPIMYLSSLPANGDYIVVLEIHYEDRSSSDEYVMGVDEYAFWLTTGSDWDEKAPLRITHSDRAYLLESYLLQTSYYDADLGKEVVTDYDGAEKILKTLVKKMQTVTVVRGESLSLYLAPFYGLKAVKVYRGLELWEAYDSEEPLALLSEWDADDYYFIFTAVYDGAEVTEVAEFPIHIKLVDEQTDTEDWPGQVHISDPESRVTLEGSKSSVIFDVCYMLWNEFWYDGGMVSGDGPGAEGQIKDLVEAGALNGYYLTHTVITPLGLRLNGHEPDLTRVIVYDKDLNHVAEASNFTAIHELPAGTYIVIMAIEIPGDYIPEADAYEAACYEYPFYLELHEK